MRLLIEQQALAVLGVQHLRQQVAPGIDRGGCLHALLPTLGVAAERSRPQAIEHAGHKDWERLILGENGIAGTLRMIGYIAVFALIFGTLFSFIR